MKNIPIVLLVLLFSSPFLNAQGDKKYDIRLRAGVHAGINELRFSPPTVEIQNFDEAPGFVFLSRELGRSFKAELAFSIVWKRTKDSSFKESWGISLGYTYNRQEYLQALAEDDFIRSLSFRYYNYLSFPIMFSRNIFWGSQDNRLELSIGPEFSVLSGGSRGYRRFISDGYLRSSLRRPNGIRVDLGIRALWKGQLYRKQDIGFGFGINYGLQSVVDQEFQLYAVESPNIRPDLIPENELYRIESKVLPISYSLILQYDISLTKRN
ncbi:MAG: hypothetical protein R8P61_34760 [Bacteroidia bacterium]|nr:hypothetical protein [Bacteroidia bacterium]